MTEKWLPIPGFAGRYEVSDCGNIRSFVPWHGQPIPHLMVPFSKGNKGHLMVILSQGGRRWPMLVHRAVLAAHVGPPPAAAPITRHLDGDETNNHLDNLKYGTHSENEFDKVRHGTHQQSRKTSCIHGHEFTAENTIVYRGGRICRACRERRNRRGAA